ncbi:MAG TPA: C45 family peptidase [Candidimonas sp.]|nr:C45 family peptidase [Candidimonas sp.]
MLSFVELSGSPFQIGQALGRFGAQAAHRWLLESDVWASVMRWRGSHAATAMEGRIKQDFPRVHEELLGLAAGLELPASDVVLWNCRGDVWAMAPDGCTTVQTPLPGGARITHNEDGNPGFAGYCAMGEFMPDHGPRFASFIYPASIPGHTFAVNEHGLAMTVNNLRTRRAGQGMPRMALTRRLLDQATLESAVQLLRDTPSAGGFHLSLAQPGRTGLLSVEFASQGVSVQAVNAPSLHANHALHSAMRDCPQVITMSSLQRQRRGSQLLRAGTAPADPASIDPLRILADRQNAEFPIYRDAPDDSDAENTMATADIHIGSEHVAWQVYERPQQSTRFTFNNATLDRQGP